MTTLRERRAELGLVQMNLWIREADRAAFAAAVEPFKRRAEALDPAQRPGRKRQEAARALPLHLAVESADPTRDAPEARRDAIDAATGDHPALSADLPHHTACPGPQRDEGGRVGL
ncbi:MAG: hypothetical protein B7Z67_13845 [Acidiphilium sp. 21-60-14]|nr:MAG: hypothetical protein B7Z67_13845 [Acidiphilium sp. 21-60-14]